MTYNFLEELALTEDRTIKNEYETRLILGKWLLTDATADQIELVLKAPEDAWEHGLSLPSWRSPSAAFVEVMRDRKKPAPTTRPQGVGLYSTRPVVEGRISPSAFRYFAPRAKAYDSPVPVRAPTPWSLAEEHPRPWRVDGPSIVDAKGRAIFAAPDDYYEGWERIADAVVRRINMTVATKVRAPTGEQARLAAGTVFAKPEEEEMPF